MCDMAINEKTFPTLYGDPVEWSRGAAGTTFRFLVFSGAHIFMGIMLVLFEGVSMIAVAIPLTVLPIYYLYALKRLLQELDRTEKDLHFAYGRIYDGTVKSGEMLE